MESTSQMPQHNLRGVDNVETVRVQVKKLPDVPICLMVDVKFKATNTPSGREYVFNGAGSVQNVDSKDAEWFLSKRQNKGCCGGGGGQPVFNLVGE